MDAEAKLTLIREVGEEIVTEDELRALLAAKPHPIAYDGFEPSGTIHIAQGLLRAINVNKMTAAGVRFKMFVADWHAWANNKMGGDLAKIQTTGEYIVEVWKATGMDLANVKFVWASEFVTQEEYWKKVMNIARDSSLDRVLRTTQIMGRSEKDKLSAAQILYPCMQAADIFHLEADITQLGMDQRKVNMLAREVAPKYGYAKPVVVSHHMLMGLQQPPAAFDTRAALHRAEKPIESLHVSWILNEVEFPPGIEASIMSVDKAAEGRATWDEMRSAIRALDKLVKETIQARLAVDEGPASVIDNLQRLSNGCGESLALVDAEQRKSEEAVISRATAMKMSKSNPDSAIFMTDTSDQVVKKLNKAFCPDKQVEDNPVMEYYRHIIFQRHWADHATARAGESPITIERPEKFGGNATYETYAELAADFQEGKVHPADLKKTAAKYINEALQPLREHFEKDEKARSLKAQVESFQVTR